MFMRVSYCCFCHVVREAVCWGCWTSPSSNATTTNFIRPCLGSHCVNISWTAQEWATIGQEVGGQREYIILFILEKEGERVSDWLRPLMLFPSCLVGLCFWFQVREGKTHRVLVFFQKPLSLTRFYLHIQLDGQMDFLHQFKICVVILWLFIVYITVKCFPKAHVRSYFWKLLLKSKRSHFCSLVQ